MNRAEMNALREEISRMLENAETTRPAALRRSRSGDALYATDLPAAASEKETERFLTSVRASSWEAVRNSGWIELNRRVDAPPEGWTGFPDGSEAACCRSLVQRERNREAGTDREEAGQDAIRKLIKAGEEGTEAFDAVCGALHREWAARLRKGQGIPAIDIRFFE